MPQLRRQRILMLLEDYPVHFLFYDRKADNFLRVGEIEEAIKAGEITVDEIVNGLAGHLRRALETKEKEDADRI